MDKQTKLILIRHGATDWNQNHRYLGHTDLPISAIGKKQSEQLKKRFAPDTFDAVYVSPAKRAQQTAEIVFSGKNAPIILHDALKEISFGKWEGLTHEEIRVKYPKALADWEKNPLISPPPLGETMAKVRERLRVFFLAFQKNHSRQSVAFIGHGGTFNIFICMILGITPNANWQFRLSPASVSEILIPKIVITVLNDTSHLG